MYMVGYELASFGRGFNSAWNINGMPVVVLPEIRVETLIGSHAEFEITN